MGQIWKTFLEKQDRAQHVNGLNFVEILGFDLSQWCKNGDRRVIDDNINLKLTRLGIRELFFDSVDQCGTSVFLRNICSNSEAADLMF